MEATEEPKELAPLMHALDLSSSSNRVPATESGSLTTSVSRGDERVPDEVWVEARYGPQGERRTVISIVVDGQSDLIVPMTWAQVQECIEDLKSHEAWHAYGEK